MLAEELPLNETFTSFQGEGPYAGNLAFFVRLGHCNLHCPVCDSKPTWDTSQYSLDETCPPTDMVEVRHKAKLSKARFLILTGGEPLIWQARPAFTKFFNIPRMKTHVETNGTLAPLVRTMEGIEHFTVSPKLSTMGAADPRKRRINPEALERFRELAESGRACFKFVVATPFDLDEVREFARLYKMTPDSVWIMPEGTDADVLIERQQELAERAARMKFNFSTRLHILNKQR